MSTIGQVSITRTLLSSLLAGMAFGVVLLGLLYGSQAGGLFSAGVNPVHFLFTWIIDNLRGSVFAFISVLVLFVVLVDRLRNLLQIQAPLAQISQVEYLADLCTSLFFGIGVIWTAIGMRSALLAGLGDLDGGAAAEIGAFGILQKLVKGGILLALSTTIVGGVGGYLMRSYKSVLVGGVLRRRYMAESRASEQAVLDRLDAIQATMSSLNVQLSSNVQSFSGSELAQPDPKSQ